LVCATFGHIGGCLWIIAYRDSVRFLSSRLAVFRAPLPASIVRIYFLAQYINRRFKINPITPLTPQTSCLWHDICLLCIDVFQKHLYYSKYRLKV
jgi:hypothetical protein